MTEPLTQDEVTFATRQDFEMAFRVPKKFVLTATGKKVGESVEGNWNVTHWKSEKPLTVAGFAFGDFKIYTEQANNVNVEILADKEPSDFFASIVQSHPLAPIGTLSPAAMAKTMGTETANTIRLFESYFGPYPYSTLAVTNIPGSYGQGWPGLLYLSAVAFMDQTQLHAFGVQDPSRLNDFFRAHESSHQWWGHRVSWRSYHDQWLSEGFATFSGNLYVEYRENPKEYLQNIRSDWEKLMSANEQNRRFESTGPVWMGRRLVSSVSPRAYSNVIYYKGGYILHMLRMMLQNPRDKFSDAPFVSVMQDFTQSFDGKAASTEDFKAIVEKHMTNAMDLDNNRRMDWFFRQYVYGTGFAHYDFQYKIESASDGKFKLSGTLNRTQTPEGWKDAIPLYVHMGKETRRIGVILAREATTPFEVMLPFKPEKVTVNDYLDTLAEIKQ
jgi:aminopeptidase N